jgi:hypothetical protein
MNSTMEYIYSLAWRKQLTSEAAQYYQLQFCTKHQLTLRETRVIVGTETAGGKLNRGNRNINKLLWTKCCSQRQKALTEARHAGRHSDYSPITLSSDHHKI